MHAAVSFSFNFKNTYEPVSLGLSDGMPFGYTEMSGGECKGYKYFHKAP